MGQALCSKLVNCCKCDCQWTDRNENNRVKVNPTPTNKKEKQRQQPRKSLIQGPGANRANRFLFPQDSKGNRVTIELQQDVLEPGWFKFIQSIFVGIFDPTRMAWIILLSAYVFVFRPAIENYQEKCPSPKKYVLSEGVIQRLYYKQVNETTITYTDLDSKTYYKECTDESNNLFEVISGLMIFMLTMALGSGLNKYREILRMYDEISGDIKALAMMMVHLTYDKQKYEYEKADKRIKFKEDIQRQYDKIKYLLSALPKVVVDTINNDGGNSGMRIRKPASTCWKQSRETIIDFFRAVRDGSTFSPFCGLSERSLVQVTPKTWCYTCCYGNRMKYPNYWMDYEKNKGDEYTNIVNVSLQEALYKKITTIHKGTGMDAFECVMTCLLDALFSYLFFIISDLFFIILKATSLLSF